MSPTEQEKRRFMVSENEELLQIFEHSKVFFATLGYTSEVFSYRRIRLALLRDAVFCK